MISGALMTEKEIDAAHHLLILKYMSVVSVLRFIKRSVVRRLQPAEDIIHPHHGAEFLKQGRKKILAWFNFFFLVSLMYLFKLISKPFNFQVNYHITHTDMGEIIEAAAAFVLGAISKEAISIEQSFEISFTQVTVEMSWVTC